MEGNGGRIYLKKEGKQGWESWGKHGQSIARRQGGKKRLITERGGNPRATLVAPSGENADKTSLGGLFKALDETRIKKTSKGRCS